MARKILVVLGFLILAAFLYHLDALSGQWRFERLCKTEGGPRIDERIEKDMGWYVEEPANGLKSYQTVFARFKHVAFVRWRDKTGALFDVYWKPAPLANRYIAFPDTDFILLPADPGKAVRYQYVFERIALPDHRFGRDQDKIIDLKTGRIVATFTQFKYQWTTPDRVILNAPTGVSCAFSYEDYRDFA